MDLRMRKMNRKIEPIAKFRTCKYLFLPSHLSFFPTSAPTPHCDNRRRRPHFLTPLPPLQLCHYPPSPPTRPLPCLQELRVAANDPFLMHHKPKQSQHSRVRFLFLSSFYKLTDCTFPFLGSIWNIDPAPAPTMMRDTAPTPCLWATTHRLDCGCSSAIMPGA